MEKWPFQRIRELVTPIALRGMAGNKIGCARISMMVRSMSSNTRPDTLMQDRTLQAYRFLLQRTAGPYIGGHSCNGGIMFNNAVGRYGYHIQKYPITVPVFDLSIQPATAARGL